MTIILNGTTGISGVDGSAGTPALQGTDVNTGISFGTDIVTINTGGQARVTTNASGNVGVGTESPAGRLNIAGGRAFFGANSEQYSIGVGYNQTRVSTGAQVYYIGATDSATPSLVFSEAGGGERMRLTSDGNLGLGVTPSAWNASYKPIELGRVGNAIMGGVAGSSMEMMTNVFLNTGGSYRYANTGAATDYYQNAGAHIWYNAPSGTAGNAISFTQAMTLDASGRLGIGTASPAEKLHVVASTNGYGLFVTDGTYSGGLIPSSSTGGLILYNGVAQPLGFWTNNAERARIDSSGNLLVGQTTNPQNAKLCISFTGGSSSSRGIVLVSGSTASTAMVAFQNPNGYPQGEILTSGTSTSYTTSSDYRLKENVEPMTGALAKVAALKPCTYTWKADGSAGQGFIAHELQAVVPDCVTGTKDAVDAEGKPQYQGVDTSFLVATLVSAIQEQQAIITKLQADVAALKGAA